MFERKSSTEQGSTDPAVEDGATRQDGRYDGVRNDGTSPGTAPGTAPGSTAGTTAGSTTGTTGAHARPVATDSERRDAGVAPAGATRTDPVDERTTRTAAAPVRDERTTTVPETAHERYGGVNIGAAFFGWLVAVAITILLTGIIGAVVADPVVAAVVADRAILDGGVGGALLRAALAFKHGGSSRGPMSYSAHSYPHFPAPMCRPPSR